MSDPINETLSSALAASAAAGIRFENAASYNRELEFTFRRTLENVHCLGGTLRILEIGSFTGVVSIALRLLGHEVTASDMPFVMEDPGVKELMQSHVIGTLPANLAEHPLPALDGTFDLIVFNEVLEHLNFNPIPLIRRFHRILAPSGRVYCATPNLLSAKNRWLMLRGHSYINPVQCLIRNLEPGTGMSVGLHWREWSKSELIELYTVCGFELECHSFGLVTPNRSNGLRRTAVASMYRLAPSLLPNQVGMFRRREKV